MKEYLVLLTIPFLFVSSCFTQPDVNGDPVQSSQPVSVQTAVVDAEDTPAFEHAEEHAFFDPGSITQEVYQTTLFDIQHLVENLNRIIRARDFDAWLLDLSDDYREWLHSREFLEELHERYPAFRETVRSARDYFLRVVVPSRANDHVDDIEYVTESRVLAFTEDARGQKVVLYSLEVTDGKWKITN